MEIGGTLPMSIIWHESIFDLQDLYDLEPIQRYDAILSAVDTDLILCKVSKKSWLGAQTGLNYAALFQSYHHSRF